MRGHYFNLEWTTNPEACDIGAIGNLVCAEESAGGEKILSLEVPAWTAQTEVFSRSVLLSNYNRTDCGSVVQQQQNCRPFTVRQSGILVVLRKASALKVFLSLNFVQRLLRTVMQVSDFFPT